MGRFSFEKTLPGGKSNFLRFNLLTCKFSFKQSEHHKCENSTTNLERDKYPGVYKVWQDVSFMFILKN